MRLAIVVLACLAGGAAADRTSRFGTFDDLKKALPAGWRLTLANNVSARGELVISRSQQVRVAGRHLANAHYGNAPVVAPPTNPPITLELKFRVEMPWTAQRLADIKDSNAVVDKTLIALRAKHRIDEIKTSKGRPLPSTPDEHRRLGDYEVESARVRALKVALPRCTLDGLYLFDDDATFRTLELMVDPPIAMREAYAIIELIKRRCH
jgi:hypothetical protein